MALPLKTIPNWVPTIIKPKILFVTENYPKNPDAIHENTFFYRTLNKDILPMRPNNLLNNICKTIGIKGADEKEKLNNFLNEKKYFLIDTYRSGQIMSTKLKNETITDTNWIDNILHDLLHIKPQQIVFTCVGSNGMLLPVLQKEACNRKLSIFDALIKNPSGKNNQPVFHSPSNRAYPIFHEQIKEAIENKSLIL